MKLFNPFISKAEAWDSIVADMRLHSPGVKDDSPKKIHVSGRRETRRQLAANDEGYRRTERGYLVRL